VLLTAAAALALLPVEKMCDQIAESFSMEQNHFYILKNIVLRNLVLEKRQQTCKHIHYRFSYLYVPEFVTELQTRDMNTVYIYEPLLDGIPSAGITYLPI
jgi:hypothetical protein